MRKGNFLLLLDGQEWVGRRVSADRQPPWKEWFWEGTASAGPVWSNLRMRALAPGGLLPPSANIYEASSSQRRKNSIEIRSGGPEHKCPVRSVGGRGLISTPIPTVNPACVAVHFLVGRFQEAMSWDTSQHFAYLFCSAASPQQLKFYRRAMDCAGYCFGSGVLQWDVWSVSAESGYQ